MPVRKKVKRFVLDVNSFVSIILNQELTWFVDYITKNAIEIYTDTFLLAELEMVLNYPRIKKYLTLKTHLYVQRICGMSIFIQAQEYYVNCPDAADNYLYNLALTANAKLLVTGDKALLNWIDSPVETITLSEFKQLF